MQNLITQDQEFKPKPDISPGSAKIISKRSASYDWAGKQNDYVGSYLCNSSESQIHKELQREMMQKAREQKTIKDKPEINKSSHLLERKIDDLFQWK